MGNPADLTASAVTVASPELRTGKILDDAGSEGQLVRCTIEALDPLLATDPMPWVPYRSASGLFYPQRGDTALIAQPLDGAPVISQWWPAEDAEPAVAPVAVSSSGDTVLSSSETKAVPSCEVVVAAGGSYVINAVFDFLCEGTGGAATGRIAVDGVEQPRQAVFAPQVVNGRGDGVAFAAVDLPAGAVIKLLVRATGGSYKALAPHTALLISPAS